MSAKILGFTLTLPSRLLETRAAALILICFALFRALSSASAWCAWVSSSNTNMSSVIRSWGWLVMGPPSIQPPSCSPVGVFGLSWARSPAFTLSQDIASGLPQCARLGGEDSPLQKGRLIRPTQRVHHQEVYIGR